MVGPLKLEAGVNRSWVFELIILTEPFGEEATVIVSGWPSTSVSLISNERLEEEPESSATVRNGDPLLPSSTATGGSLTEVTLT